MTRLGRRKADLLLVNARVLTLNPRRPKAEALAIRSGRVLAVGGSTELRELVGRDTEVVDGEGGVAVPSFHDAHCHLLSYARWRSRLDCRGMGSIADIVAAVRGRAASLAPGAWVQAVGYDEALLAEGRHPDRHDLDAAAPKHPVRLQHRSLHLDVLNTTALRLLQLMHAGALQIERDPLTGEPTGRLYHAAEIVQGRERPQAARELAEDVRLASQELLARGITTVQDATFTNGPSEWALFQRLVDAGDIQLRVYLFRGARYWREFDETTPRAVPGPGETPSKGERPNGSPPMPRASPVRLGPVKFMLEEGTTDPERLRTAVAEVRAAGQATAFHAVSEAEVAMALDALRRAPSWRGRPGQGPDRIEHGAVIPDALLGDLRAAGVMVVGQPGLVYERGDTYRAEYPPDLHGWIHRARSLLAAGIPYAASSDAPVTEPRPLHGLYAARRRATRGGYVLGSREALGSAQALRAFTLAPAEAVGAAHELGQLRPGAIADVTILDPEALGLETVAAANHLARMTIMEGRIVWRRAASA